MDDDSDEIWSSEEMLFNSVNGADDRRWTTAYPIWSPRAFGSGELKINISESCNSLHLPLKTEMFAGSVYWAFVFTWSFFKQHLKNSMHIPQKSTNQTSVLFPLLWIRKPTTRQILKRPLSRHHPSGTKEASSELGSLTFNLHMLMENYRQEGHDGPISLTWVTVDSPKM